MSTRHEKNVQRKERARERKNAIARSLRSQPLRPINTCGLQTLQQALGLPPGPHSPLREQLPKDNCEYEIMDKETDSRAVLSNVPDIPFNTSTAVATSVLTPRDFGSWEPEPLDAIFIAIDFEHSHYSPKTGRMRLREVGISKFDTRDLHHQDIYVEDIISAQHYRTVADTKKFLFGKTNDTSQDELVLILKRLLYLVDAPPRETRNIILVGHGFGFEVKAMKGLGVDLSLASSVIDIFDTEFLGYEVFGKDFKCSLSNVVKETGISGGFFHNAGNDANFSLRAMLLLAIHCYDTSEMDIGLRERLEMYRKLAQF